MVDACILNWLDENTSREQTAHGFRSKLESAIFAWNVEIISSFCLSVHGRRCASESSAGFNSWPGSEQG
jgi:hypothetical protein